MVQHAVVFSLKYPKSSMDEKKFLDAALRLGSIPGVRHLKCHRQTSKKNNFHYGLTMEFETDGAYQAYNTHPDHLAFIKDFWIDGVEDFIEIDYAPYP